MYFAYLVCIIILFIIGIALVRWIKSQIEYIKLINKIPGPPTTPILGNVREILCSPEQLWLNIRRLSKEHYPIYKLWACHNPSVFMTLPEDVEILISSTKHMTKSPIYKCLHAWLGFGLLTSSGNKWHLRRKLLTPAFHFSILKQFLMVFSEASDLLVNELEAECTNSSTDILPHISRFTLNTICETAMGTVPEELGYNEKNYRSAIYEMGRLIVYRIARPWIYNDLTFLFTTTFWKQRKVSNLLHLFSSNVITKRKNNTENTLVVQGEVSSLHKKRLAMLDLLLSAQNSGELINDEGIREEVDTFMFEGHDTTSMALCYTLMLLACHQDVQEKVREEVINVTKDSNGRYSYDNLQELKYLEMVLKESLRMYPSVPFISRQTSEDILTYSGYTIPSDSTVNVLIYDIHHNPLYYPSPEKFDPERFSLENCKNRHPFAYIPFSAGPRNCIGQRFAILELKMAVAKIIQRFHLHPVDTPNTITIATDLLLRTTNGIRIKLERRNI